MLAGTDEDYKGVRFFLLREDRKRNKCANLDSTRAKGDLRPKQRTPEGAGTTRGSRKAGGRAVAGPEGVGRSTKEREPTQDRPAAGTPTGTRGAAGGPSAALGAEAEVAASSCSGHPPAKPHPPPGLPPCSRPLLNFFPTVNTPAAKECARLERPVSAPPVTGRMRQEAFPAPRYGTSGGGFAYWAASFLLPIYFSTPDRKFPRSKKPRDASCLKRSRYGEENSRPPGPV